MAVHVFAFGGPRTDASEAIASRVCSSKLPVLVIDCYAGDPSNELSIDVDGDGGYDLYHGDFVARLVELNGQSTRRLLVGTPVFSTQVADILHDTAAKIERGELSISWINFSQGFTVEIGALNSLVGEKNLINAGNVHQHASRVLEPLWTKKPKLKIKELNDAFLRLEKIGVPVVVAAANSGFNEVNIYSLFPNVISVGALDLDGKKAAYSADNSTVTIWRQGSILSYGVDSGADLNSDGRADVSLRTPSVPEAIVARFHGQYGTDLVKRVPPEVDRNNDDNRAKFFDLTSKLPEGLYSTLEILRKTLGTGFQRSRYIQSLGEYFYMDGIHPRPLFFAKMGNDGRIVMKQGLRQNGRVYRNVLYGTSFASPNLCDGERTPDHLSL